jgi:NADH dehydrogenase
MFSPMLPVLGRAPHGPSFQPVYVGDVAQAIANILDTPETAGKTYELGGPRTYTLAEIQRLVLEWTGRKRLVAWLPPWIVNLQATALEFLPVPPLTRDQVKLLQTDNICYGKAPGLAELGIQPTPAEAVAPGYLTQYRRAGARGLA